MTNTTTHTIKDPKVQTIEAVYEAFGRADLDGVLAHLADDVDWAAEASSESAPWYGSYQGKAEVPRWFQALGTSAEITEFTVISLTSNDTDVMAVVRIGYTVRSTGKHVEQNLHHWWRFADGKIVMYRGLDDSELTAAAFAG